MAVKMKEHYDAAVKPKQYNVGDLILLYTPKTKRGQFAKWQPLWNGPFWVIKIINSVNYVVQKTPHSRSFIVHINRIWPYYVQPQSEMQHGQLTEPASSSQSISAAAGDATSTTAADTSIQTDTQVAEMQGASGIGMQSPPARHPARTHI